MISGMMTITTISAMMTTGTMIILTRPLTTIGSKLPSLRQSVANRNSSFSNSSLFARSDDDDDSEPAGDDGGNDDGDDDGDDDGGDDDDQ